MYLEILIKETLILLQAIQYNDKYGEVCPSSWEPGDMTMKDDVELSKEYFKP